jgi:hypothetical protein
MYNLQSTKVIECPALAFGLYLLSLLIILDYISHVEVDGSNVYKSLKQKACGPLPPNK